MLARKTATHCGQRYSHTDLLEPNADVDGIRLEWFDGARLIIGLSLLLWAAIAAALLA